MSMGADVNATMSNGSTALHLLAVKSAAKAFGEMDKIKVQNNYLRAIRLLLDHPETNIDMANNIGVTPLYFAIEKGSDGAVKLLLEKGACVTTEVDGETVEEFFEAKRPNLFRSVNLDRNRRNSDTIESKLFQLLYSDIGNPRKFIKSVSEAMENNNQVDLNANNGTYTFLQYVCDQGAHEIVEFLLKSGADPNKMALNCRTPPIVLAAYHGYFNIIKVFKDFELEKPGSVFFSAPDEIKQETVLHKALKAESKAHANYNQRSYDRTLNILLDCNPFMQSLMRGSIDAQDQLGNTPLHVAGDTGNHDVLFKLLRSGANIGVKNKHDETPIDLIPSSVMEQFFDECLQEEGAPSDDDFQLTFKYTFLGPPMSRYLKQALLSKEQELNQEEGLDVTSSNEALPETEPLWYLSQSSNHKQLLLHPIISSFLCLKWRKMRPYYYINLAIYLIFVALVTSYLLLSRQYPEKSFDALKSVTIVFLAALTLREVFQAMVSFRRYIFNVENLLEISMLGVLYLVFFGSIDSDQTMRSLSGAALLLTWVEMMLLFGRHPKLSMYITMFTTVSVNFFLFLTWYISLIIAFGLVFFIILQRPETGADEEPNAYFSSPSKSLYKTVIMSLTGEIEFENIDFGGLFAIFLFLLYVFFIMLVLINLLNGLAVSDISEIQKHAEIVSLSSRVELISYMESMLLGDPFDFLTNWPPVGWLQRMPACSCLKAYYSLKPVRKMCDAVIGNTQLFQSRLKKKEAIFFPNKTRFESSGPKAEKDNLILDGSILKAATEIVVRRKSNDDAGKRMERMEKDLLLLAKQNNYIIDLLKKLH